MRFEPTNPCEACRGEVTDCSSCEYSWGDGMPRPIQLPQAGWWVEDRLWAAWLDGVLYTPH